MAVHPLLASDPEAIPAADWVSVCDPARVGEGYTLVFFERRYPVLIDLNGSIAHAWPAAQAKGRMRLLPNGNLLALWKDNSIRELSWEGEELWRYHLPSARDFPHHDLQRLANGNTLAIFRDEIRGTDYLLELNRDGLVVWSWRSFEHLAEEIAAGGLSSNDLTHFNSVQELPPNRFYDDGDSRFRPGNLLVSARELNLVFIIDRGTREVVWRYDRGLDAQHEAQMLTREQPGAGNILLFDNGAHDLGAYRTSRIVELDPQRSEVVWSYSSPTFFSETGGSQQRLANGNTLISSSHSDRCFEVTPAGEIVWQWTPPFRTMREIRYPKEYCPQLTALPNAAIRARTADPDYPYIDKDLHRFGLRKDFRPTEIRDDNARVLEQPELCRELWLPDRPVVELEYGFDTERFPRLFPPSYNATFRATVQDLVKGIEQVLVDDAMTSTEPPPWRATTVSLPELGRRRVLVCLTAATTPDRPLKGGMSAAAWRNPVIRSADVDPATLLDGAGEAASGDDPKIIEQHLRALGYVD